MPDAPLDDAAAVASPEDALKSGFEAALKALVDSALAGEIDEGEAIKRFKELLTTHGKLTSTPVEDAPPVLDEVVEGDDEEGEEEEEEVTESRKTKRTSGAIVLTESKAKQLCTLADVTPDAELLEAMTGSTEEKGIKLLEWAKGKAKTAASKPRSQGFVPPNSNARVAKNADELATLLKS
jgi:hypothetical protein